MSTPRMGASRQEPDWVPVILAGLGQAAFVALLALLAPHLAERPDWLLPAVVGSSFVATAMMLMRAPLNWAVIPGGFFAQQPGSSSESRRCS